MPPSPEKSLYLSPREIKRILRDKPQIHSGEALDPTQFGSNITKAALVTYKYPDRDSYALLLTTGKDTTVDWEVVLGMLTFIFYKKSSFRFAMEWGAIIDHPPNGFELSFSVVEVEMKSEST